MMQIEYISKKKKKKKKIFHSYHTLPISQNRTAYLRFRNSIKESK